MSTKTNKSPNKFMKFVNGLSNAIANLGTSKDKKTHSKFTKKDIPIEDLNTMYANWLVRKIVNIPVEDATRKWRKFKGLDQDQTLLLENTEKRLAVKKTLKRGGSHGRLYGGSLVLMGIDGTGNLDSPLNIDSVAQDSLRFLKVLDRDVLKPGDVDTDDPNAVNFMTPEFYEMGEVKIHSSRVLRFDGADTPDSERKNRDYWSTSIPEIVYDAVLGAESMIGSANSLVYEAVINVVKLPGLANMLTQPDGPELLRERFILLDQIKSNHNMALFDAEEDFIRSTYDFTALVDLIKSSLMIASSAADIPATRLLGQSAIGFNATGEGDQENYTNMVRGYQEDQLEPEINKLDEVLLRSTFGTIPDGYSWEFLPLHEPSEKEKAETDKLNMETRVGYKDAGVILPYIIAAQLAAEGVFGALDDNFVNLLKQIDLGGEGEIEEKPDGATSKQRPPDDLEEEAE